MMKSMHLPVLLGAALLIAPVPVLAAAPGNGTQDKAEQPVPETPSAAKLALAEEIVTQGFPEDVREDIFFGSIDQMTAQMREATLRSLQIEDKGALAVLDEWLAEYIATNKEILRDYIPRMMDGLAVAYASIFTRQELEDIAAFVATPSGQRFMVLSSAVLAEPTFAAVNQEYINEIQDGAPAAMQDLQGRIIQYLTDKEAASAQTES